MMIMCCGDYFSSTLVQYFVNRLYFFVTVLSFLRLCAETEFCAELLDFIMAAVTSQAFLFGTLLV